MTVAQLWQGWRKFWFEPQSPTPMALYRILFGILAFLSAAVFTLPDLDMWYGEHSVTNPVNVARVYHQNYPQINVLLMLPPGNQALYLFFYAYLVALVFLIFGLFTRYSAIFVAIALISFQNQQPYNLNGGDAMLKLAAEMLALSHCGDAISLDRLIKRFGEYPVEPVKCSPWAQRLLQCQLAIAYADTFACKIMGAQWLEGTAVYFATRLDDMFKIPLPFVSNSLFMCKFSTYFTLIVEGALFTLIWFRDMRYWVLLAGLMLHLGIDTMINLPIFEWIFMATFVTFVYPETLTKVADYVKAQSAKRFGAPTPLLINESLRYQLQLASIVESLDVFGRVKTTPMANQSKMEIETKNGKLSGFQLFSWLCLRLPLLWFLLPFVRIFGLSFIARSLFALCANIWLRDNSDALATG